MSRYAVPASGKESFIVGWDPPLGTFFAQEYGPSLEDDEDNLVWWIGYEPGEVTTIADLRRWCLDRGVVIPQDIDDALRRDESEPWTPGPLQRALGFTGKGEG